ncbi:PotD/PotF family extracellular solute-binding protein [Acuticoccus sp. I52.16.1]|uniref:ABC transporter substrate-binding protein n=1 Tax=Acuticoccus sp. I52.16.1 TaxID=2928472 RepID=UPI001FD387B7|nr:extracellular solute-binding protein [Acuticoccus sp. I52.16.1]UOM35561.1 ABC transporter substrate-binding protein [Acuticoccus sp. I52.16.1]
MDQMDFTRRFLLKSVGAAGLVGATSSLGLSRAFAADPLRIWTIGVAKVGAEPGTGGKDWGDMGAQAGIDIVYNAKSGSADQAIQKFVVGDGNDLYDAITDNGGGMEDALASQSAITALDTAQIPNFANIIDAYKDGGDAASTIRYDDTIYAIPYISNADSLAFDFEEVGEELTSWEACFAPEFKGRVALQNDFGPTFTNTAIYLKQSGQLDIADPSDMTADEVAGVAEFLITKKQEGQFRTFWDGFQNGVDLLSSGEVLLQSCWEPVQIVAAKKAGKDIRYGTMKEGHQTWNNIWMLTNGGDERGQAEAFYKLMNLYLDPWFGARIIATYGYQPQMTGVMDYIDSSPDFSEEMKAVIAERRERQQARYAVPGNSWQNVFPTEIRAYQDWWSKVQSA